eukprot:scaffold43248_cov31-Tisochrysis_lutea.AAC.1
MGVIRRGPQASRAAIDRSVYKARPQLEAELVNVHDGAKRYEANERVGCRRREQLQHLLERVLKRLELLLLHARVDDPHEDGRASGGPWQCILDGGILRDELGREIIFRNIVVVRRKVVPLETERADPNLGLEVNAAVRVEHCRAGTLAHHRLVRQERQAFDGLEWRVQAAQRYDHPRGLEPRRGPHVPARKGGKRGMGRAKERNVGRWWEVGRSSFSRFPPPLRAPTHRLLL